MGVCLSIACSPFFNLLVTDSGENDKKNGNRDIKRKRIIRGTGELFFSVCVCVPQPGVGMTKVKKSKVTRGFHYT